MDVQHFDINRLNISPLNMRFGKKPPEIDDILPSIRKRGLIQPIVVRPCEGEQDREVVAGRRRYYGCLAVHEEALAQGLDPAPIPCVVMQAGDDVEALEVSILENVARLNPHEVERRHAFARLADMGREVSEIATLFGVTDLMVRRALALGNLLPRIRNLYRDAKIDAASIRHLTLATKAQQKAWLALVDSEDERAPLGHQLKSWLFGGQAIPVANALFDLESYGGAIVSDLFGEDRYFGDNEAFWAAQKEAIEAKRSGYLEDGWSDVVVLGPDDYFQRWDHEPMTKKKGGKIFVSVARAGEVAFHEGFLTRAECKRRSAANDNMGEVKPIRSEITSTLQSYVDLHRHAAIRGDLVGRPAIALRLLVAHAIAGSRLWTVRVEPRHCLGNDALAESVENAPAEGKFDAARRAVLELLQFDPDEATVTGGQSSGLDTTGVFARLTALSDKQVIQVFCVVMGETLAAGSIEAEAVGNVLGTDMGRHWKADDAFFDMLRDREVMLAMLAHAGGEAVAKAHEKEKLATIRNVLRDHVRGENGRAKPVSFLPGWMQFPAAAVTKRGGFRTAGYWPHRKALFQKPEGQTAH